MVVLQGKRKRLRVGFLVSNISRLGGGVSAFVIKLAKILNKTEFEPIIFCSQDNFLQEDAKDLSGITIVSRFCRGPLAFRYTPGLLGDLLGAEIDLLHLNGIWQYPSVAGLTWMRQTRRPYVVSPHGMLEDWILRRGRLKKLLATELYEKSNISSAHLVHALTETESNQIRCFAHHSRVAVVPNGVEIQDDSQDAKHRDYSRDPYILYLGRLHPKKNVEAAIEAWIALADSEERRNYRLLIAGWGEQSYIEKLISGTELLGPAGQIEFTGPVYGGDKQRLLEGAAFVILPSLSEGLPMAILEAWAMGIPTLMSSYCNLPDGFTSGAAMNCGTSVEAIRAALLLALRLSPADRQAMSGAAAALVRRKFSMPIVAIEWENIYRNLHASQSANYEKSRLDHRISTMLYKTESSGAVLDAREAQPLHGGPSFHCWHRLYRAFWAISWLLLCAWTPAPLHAWRRFLLRLFGARIAKSSHIYSSTRVWYPPNLAMAEYACLGPRVICYNIAPIVLQKHAIVSQGAHLCTGSHDIFDHNFQLIAKPITIQEDAWVAAEAFVGPGVTLGEGSVLGARSVAFQDLLPWTVYVGNPAASVSVRTKRSTEMLSVP